MLFDEPVTNTSFRNTESIGFGKQGKGAVGNGMKIRPLLVNRWVSGISRDFTGFHVDERVREGLIVWASCGQTVSPSSN